MILAILLAAAAGAAPPSCLTYKTNAHIEELKRQRDCAEGDLTCNPPDK